MATTTRRTIAATATDAHRGMVSATIDDTSYQFYADVDDYLNGYVDVRVAGENIRITF